MIYGSKTFTLANGEKCELKSPFSPDAADMLNYLKQASDETDYMIRYPDEVIFTLEDEQKLLEAICKNPRAVMINSRIDGRLIGNISLNCIAEKDKTRHRASMGVAIIKDAWGKGIGKLLMTEIISAAKSMNYEQIELEVAEKNERAVALYEKFGFERYGRRINGFKLRDGTYLDELLMIKIL